MSFAEDLWEADDARKAAERSSNANTARHVSEPVHSDETTPYGAAVLAAEYITVSEAVEGERNHVLNARAFKVAQLVAGGEIAHADAEETLTLAAGVAGLGLAEIRQTLDSAFQGGARDPRQRADLDEGLAEWMHEAGVTESVAGGTGIAGNSAETTAPAGSSADDADTGPSTNDGKAQTAKETDDRKAQYEKLVKTKALELSIVRDAKRQLDQRDATATFRVPDYLGSLTAELQIPDEAVTYAVDQLMPTGSNVLLTASRKTGKTHLVNHLVKCLADGQPFLGSFDVTRNGRVALFNYEVGRDQYRRWLREVDIDATDHVVPLNLRGFRLPLVVPHIEDWVVEWLKAHEIGFWIVDPFARAFTGSGTSENDNTEVGVFLDTLDVIKERAGVSELVLPTHTGKGVPGDGAERARGATRLEDWADVLWSMTKDEAGDHDRYFSAFGRDVELDEGRLDYDANTRGYSFKSGEDRSATKGKGDIETVLRVVASEPGLTKNALQEATHIKRPVLLPLVDRLVADELIVKVPRKGGGDFYYIKGHAMTLVPESGSQMVPE